MGPVSSGALDAAQLVRVYGHRGARMPGGPPENTLAAVQVALAAGAAGVEIDVRRAPSGALVCRHDPFPLVAPGTPADQADLPIPGLPALQDVLRAASGGRVIIEIKNAPHEPGYEPPDRLTVLHDVLAMLTDADDVVISSFDFAVTLAAIQAGVTAAHLLIPGVALRAAVAWARDHGAAEIHPPVQTVLAEPQGVRAAQAAGLRVVAWAATADEQLAGLVSSGVDAVICDDPASAVREVARLAGA